MVKIVVVFMVLAVLVLGQVVPAAAMCGMCGSGGEKAHSHEALGPAAAKESSDIGNKICPVTGEAVDMDNPVTYEYKGKLYNLCCPACVSAFEKDPEKYAKIAEEGLKPSESAHEGHSH